MLIMDAHSFSDVVDHKLIRKGKLSKLKSQTILREIMEQNSTLVRQVDGLRTDLQQFGYVHAKIQGLSDLHVQDSKTVVSALMTFFGELSLVPNTKIIAWDVKPSDKDATNLYGTAADVASNRTGRASFHTDGAGRETPESAFGLFCLHPASDGGESVLVGIHDVVEYLSRHHALAFECLSTNPLIWGIGERKFSRCLFWTNHNGTRIAYRRDAIVREGNSVDYDTLGALGVFEQLIEQDRFHTTIHLEADEFLIIDNLRLLHGRGPFLDPMRHLLRVRVW